MKRFLMWSFERGSAQYDVICVVILAFILGTPPSWFNDRPEYMRIPGSEIAETGRDDRGNVMYTVRALTLEAATEVLRRTVDTPFLVRKSEPIYDTRGGLVAYALWVER